MALGKTIKRGTRPKQASLLGHQGKRWGPACYRAHQAPPSSSITCMHEYRPQAKMDCNTGLAVRQGSKINWLPRESLSAVQVIGHWSGPFDAETCTEQPDRETDLLDYVQARKHIYMPAFTWVLENSPAAREALESLQRRPLPRSLCCLTTTPMGT